MKQRSFFKSLRGKVSLQMLLVSLIPILVIVGLVWNSMANLEDKTDKSVDISYSTLEENVIQETLSQDAYRMALEVEKDMAVRVDFINGYATSPILRDAILSGDPDSPEVQEANIFLAEQFNVSPWFTTFVVVDSNGRGVAGAHFSIHDGTPAPGIHPAYAVHFENNFTDTYWWDKFLARNTEVIVSDMQFIPSSLNSQALDVFVLDIISEIRDADGKAIGAIFSATSFNPVPMSVNYTAKYPNTRVMVFSPINITDNWTADLDRNDPMQMIRIVADSGDWIMGDEIEPKKTVQVDGTDLPAMRWFDHANNIRIPEAEISYTPAEQQVRNIIATASDEVIPAGAFTTDDGSHVVGYARASTDLLEEELQTEGYSGTGFTFMAEQPAEVAFAALESLDTLESDLEDNTTNMLATILVILAVVFIVVLAVAFYLSRGITRPIVQLSEAAEKVSMGDLDVSVDIKSDDEIGDLAESYGRMVTAVRFLSEDEGE